MFVCGRAAGAIFSHRIQFADLPYLAIFIVTRRRGVRTELARTRPLLPSYGPLYEPGHHAQYRTVARRTHAFPVSSHGTQEQLLRSTQPPSRRTEPAQSRMRLWADVSGSGPTAAPDATIAPHPDGRASILRLHSSPPDSKRAGPLRQTTASG